MAAGKIEAVVYETLGWLEKNQLAGQVTIEMILFARASTTRDRCLEHASRSFAWTTSEFHGPRGKVPAEQKC